MSWKLINLCLVGCQGVRRPSEWLTWLAKSFFYQLINIYNCRHQGFLESEKPIKQEG